MTGASVNILTERLDAVASRECAPVTSRSLLDGIFTVKRIDVFDSTGGSEGDRETVTDGEAVARVSLVVLVFTLESGEVGGLPRAGRERRERVDMADAGQADV